MTDAELDIDLQDEGEEKINKAEKRIKDLSEKVKLTSQERDEMIKAKEALATEKQALEKERDFFKGFSTLASKYQAAAEYQDKIMDKVMSGYDVEDATVAILAKEGKLTMPAAVSPVNESPVGGSATNTVKTGGEKPLSEMTQAERKAALQQVENEGGELTKFFRAG